MTDYHVTYLSILKGLRQNVTAPHVYAKQKAYLTASLSAFPGLNAGTLLAGIWIS